MSLFFFRIFYFSLGFVAVTFFARSSCLSSLNSTLTRLPRGSFLLGEKEKSRLLYDLRTSLVENSPRHRLRETREKVQNKLDTKVAQFRKMNLRVDQIRNDPKISMYEHLLFLQAEETSLSEILHEIEHYILNIVHFFPGDAIELQKLEALKKAFAFLDESFAQVAHLLRGHENRVNRLVEMVDSDAANVHLKHQILADHEEFKKDYVDLLKGIVLEAQGLRLAMAKEQIPNLLASRVSSMSAWEARLLGIILDRRRFDIYRKLAPTLMAENYLGSMRIAAISAYGRREYNQWTSLELFISQAQVGFEQLFVTEVPRMMNKSTPENYRNRIEQVLGAAEFAAEGLRNLRDKEKQWHTWFSELRGEDISLFTEFLENLEISYLLAARAMYCGYLDTPHILRRTVFPDVQLLEGWKIDPVIKRWFPAKPLESP